MLKTARIGVKNRYAYDYACEDEYFEREMTMYDARTLPLPLPKDFSHAQHPDNEVWPMHWNDVRFNFKPQNQDRRAFIHDNMMNAYDFHHDFAHTTGYIDEDLDQDMPDPYPAMHFKKKRSGAMMFLGAFVTVGAWLFFPTIGFKIPQKDNPFYYRKKYAQSSAIQQFQRYAMMEYGANVPKHPESSVMITQDGFKHSGHGLRFELDNYNDLIC